MILDIVHYIVSFSLVFISIYSCGISITKFIDYRKEFDVFFIIVSGYFFVGILSLIFHFFISVNNLFSLLLILFSFFLFFFNKKNIFTKDFLILFILSNLLGIILISFSDHPIDANMYHHPYISYLKSEKIIFGVANLEFRFGHISFMQYVQAVYVNNLFHLSVFAAINIIFFTSFVYTIIKNFFLLKKFNYCSIVSFLIVTFLLIKFSRYREYGNDLIPLLVCFYFFIQIINEINMPTNTKKFLINIFPIFIVFILSHKISYVFSGLIFLILLNYKKNNFFKNLKKGYCVFAFIFLVLWVIKNYINTSCLIFPIEFTCIKNSHFQLFGLSDPSNVSFLSELWAKAFIDHPDWQSLDLHNFIKGFNWVSNWSNSHLIKIFEKLGPLLFFIVLVFVYFFILRKKIVFLEIEKKILIKNYLLLLLILFGLFIWFLKAPLFRYGAFYITSFLIMFFTIIINHFFYFRDLKSFNFFKVLICLSIIFFIGKNFQRISNSNSGFFPKTTLSSEKYQKIEKEKLIFLKSINDVCYFTKYICSHELPNNFKLKRLGNYYLVTN